VIEFPCRQFDQRHHSLAGLRRGELGEDVVSEFDQADIAQVLDMPLHGAADGLGGEHGVNRTTAAQGLVEQVEGLRHHTTILCRHAAQQAAAHVFEQLIACAGELFHANVYFCYLVRNPDPLIRSPTLRIQSFISAFIPSRKSREPPS